MAINLTDDGKLIRDNITSHKEPKVETTVTEETEVFKPQSLMFGGKSPLDIVSIKAGRGRENITKVAKNVQELLATKNQAKGVRIHVFDNSIFTNLEYSNITFSLVEGSELYYYIVLFTSTGRKPKTALEISSIAFNTNNNQRFNEIWTTDEAINDHLHRFVINRLKSDYNNSSLEAIPLEGVVINDFDLDIDILSERIFFTACTILITESNILSNKIADLNIKESVSNVSNKFLNIETNYMVDNVLGMFGEYYRSDWTSTLVYRPSNQSYSIQQLNSASEACETLCTINGFVDVIPTIHRDPVARVEYVRYRPHIIITKTTLDYPTLNYLMLGILSSLVMVNRNQYVASIFYGSFMDPGALNILTKLDDGAGAPLKLKDPKRNPSDTFNVLSEMVCLEPVVSIDIPHYNDSSNFLSPLLGSTGGDNYYGESIVNSLFNMTGGEFDSNFQVNDIFNNSGVIIPMGYWNSKQGTRDIRDVDLNFILNSNNDINMANMWALSSLPTGVNGVDPYLVKVDVISKLIPDAVITGKATRLTFTSSFINALQNAARRAGFMAIHKPAIEIVNNTYDITSLSNYYNQFGLNNTNMSFIGQGVNNNAIFNNYSTMGRRIF